jgi:DUF4097 and DUF4098 domain-containing protein YvlB
MSRTRSNAIDVLGITLGVIAILIVVGSVVTIARGRMFDAQWAFIGRHVPWNDGDFSFGPAVREEKDEQVPAGATEIEVRNVAGSIEISGNPGAAAIAVHSVKTAPFRGALDRVHVDIQKEGNRLIVAEKHDPGFLTRTGTVSFRVVVPRGLKVIEAHSVSGGITVQGVEQGIDQDLSTISGGITTERARNLDASSTSGSIHFTSGGSTLNVRSVSGSIDGVIESLGSGGSAHMSTVSGSVTLSAFAALDATVSLHTLSGNVSCGFPLTVSDQKKNRLSGTIGKGSANVDVGTISGSISIARM